MAHLAHCDLCGAVITENKTFDGEVLSKQVPCADVRLFVEGDRALFVGLVCEKCFPSAADTIHKHLVSHFQQIAAAMSGMSTGEEG